MLAVKAFTLASSDGCVVTLDLTIYIHATGGMWIVELIEEEWAIV
tara:strand:+ start:448 stop:582 length:135 start_codon:yes stop_codon:yes gene_type:complete